LAREKTRQVCEQNSKYQRAGWSSPIRFYPIGGIMKAIATLIAGLFAAGVAFAQAPAAPAKKEEPNKAEVKKEEKKEAKKDDKKDAKK
jgi:hypothetical protein